MEGRQNLAGLLSLPVVPCAVFHPVRVPCASHGCKRAARAASGAGWLSSILSGCRVPLMDAKELPEGADGCLLPPELAELPHKTLLYYRLCEISPFYRMCEISPFFS